MKQDLGLMYGEQNLDLMYSMMTIISNIVYLEVAMRLKVLITHKKMCNNVWQ